MNGEIELSLLLSKARRPMRNNSLRIAFIHPDLGIGGAEGLVVAAALHLQHAGHTVTVFAGHHDKKHCIEETRDGTLDVRTCSFFFPSHIAQRFRVFCALARTAYLASRFAFADNYDV